MWFLPLVVIAGGALAMAADSEQPRLDDVLKRTARYVAAFHERLTGIVAEETYTQTAGSMRSTLGFSTRTLKSDLVLLKPAGADRYVELRDVFEADGRPVRDREARLERLLVESRSGPRIAEIIAESARYNIGGIERNINTPLMALQLLDEDEQPRFRFRHAAKPQAVFGQAADARTGDPGVFRVTTEMWTIAFEERRRPTIVRQPNGKDLPARGRFWINPSDGAVLISEIVLDGGGVKAAVTVSYQSEPLMGLLVPVEMRESYAGRGEQITGEAVYGRFRPVNQRAP